jgi:hypothetical protein
MTKKTINRAATVITMLAGLTLATDALAETTTAPASAPERPSMLARANADALRQLRPSGLQAHARNFSRVASRGYHDVLTKLHAESSQPPRR